jgi:hypothetical protein
MVRTPRPNDPKVQSGVSMLLRKCSIFGPRPGVRLASPFSLHPRRGQCREREETRSREERQEKRKDKLAIAICKCVQGGSLQPRIRSEVAAEKRQTGESM